MIERLIDVPEITRVYAIYSTKDRKKKLVHTHFIEKDEEEINKRWNEKEWNLVKECDLGCLGPSVQPWRFDFVTARLEQEKYRLDEVQFMTDDGVSVKVVFSASGPRITFNKDRMSENPKDEYSISKTVLEEIIEIMDDDVFQDIVTGIMEKRSLSYD